MQKDRSNWTVRKGTFAEVEEFEIEDYASTSWKESAAIVERMLLQIWSEAYGGKKELIIRRSTLKDLTDDFE